MATEQELASAANRRPIGNAQVAPRCWEGFEGVTLSGPRTSLEPVVAERDSAGYLQGRDRGRGYRADI